MRILNNRRKYTRDDVIDLLANYKEYCSLCDGWGSYTWRSYLQAYECDSCGFHTTFPPEIGTLDKLQDIVRDIHMREDSVRTQEKS